MTIDATRSIPTLRGCFNKTLPPIVSYKRLSTRKQKNGGLGIEVQLFESLWRLGDRQRK
jgi:hypothetical protein